MISVLMVGAAVALAVTVALTMKYITCPSCFACARFNLIPKGRNANNGPEDTEGDGKDTSDREQDTEIYQT